MDETNIVQEIKSSSPSNNQFGSPSLRFFQCGTAIDFSIIAFFWWLAVVLVNPIGDFPLNDDWAFGITVKRLIEEGTFHPPGWVSMSLITQVLWGALFCIPFGFSFTALRFSTLLLSLLGIFSIYIVVRSLACPRWLAVCGALIMVFNPIYFSLSHTFMTDVPFMAFTALSLLFFIRNLQFESDTYTYLLLGSCLATIAILCRQIGLFLPLAFGLTLLVKHGFSRRWLFRASLPTLMGLCALLGFQHWLKVTGKMPASYGLQILRLLYIFKSPERLFTNFTHNSFTALLYLGLFLLPILVVFLSFKEENTRLVWFVKGIFLIFTFLSMPLIFLDQLMPLSSNILIREGIGPLTLRDTYFLHLPHMPALPYEFWMIVTILSILGAGGILVHIVSIIIMLVSDIKLLRQESKRITTFFFLSGALIYFLPLAIQGFFDRYLVPLIFLIFAALFSSRKNPGLASPRSQIASAIVLLFFFSLFSVTTTHDYLAWNRTRWKALRSLLANEDIMPSQIDGGFEFNGLYFYNHDYQRSDKKSWWWVLDDTYMLTFGKVSGYEVIYNYDFTRWMPPYKGSIVILRRQVESPSEVKNHAK